MTVQAVLVLMEKVNILSETDNIREKVITDLQRAQSEAKQNDEQVPGNKDETIRRKKSGHLVRDMNELVELEESVATHIKKK